MDKKTIGAIRVQLNALLTTQQMVTKAIGQDNPYARGMIDGITACISQVDSLEEFALTHPPTQKESK